MMNAYRVSEILDVQIKEYIKQYPLTKQTASGWLLVVRSVKTSLQIIEHRCLTLLGMKKDHSE